MFSDFNLNSSMVVPDSQTHSGTRATMLQSRSGSYFMKSTTRHLFGQRCLIGFIVLGITVLIAGQRHRTTAQAISQTPSAALSAPQGKEPQRPTLRGSAAIEQLKKDGQYDSLQAAMKQARYTVQRAEVTPLGRAAWHAPNPAHGYDAYVTEEGVSIALAQDSYVSLTLRGVGYGGYNMSARAR